MEEQIHGKAFPTLELTLAAEDVVVLDPGRITWYAPSVTLHTGTGPRQHRGLACWPRRLGLVVLAAHVPGASQAIDLGPGKRGWSTNTASWPIPWTFPWAWACSTRFPPASGAARGFRLQKVTGPGRAWIALGGDPVVYDLQPHELLNVHPGMLAAFQDTVGRVNCQSWSALCEAVAPYLPANNSQ